MTTTQDAAQANPGYLVGDRVRVQHQGRTTPGRISAVLRRGERIEYVIRTDAVDGGCDSVVNVWTTSGRSAYLAPATGAGAGESR